jgi:Domain of unknown function (DUF397)
MALRSHRRPAELIMRIACEQFAQLGAIAMQPGLSGAAWIKSSHSNPDGSCVEVARNLPGIVAVRDSKNPAGPALTLNLEAWRAFIRGIAAGELTA